MSLARPGDDDADYKQLEDDLERFNASPEDREKVLAKHRPRDTYIHAEHLQAYEIFITDLQTQWNHSVSGARTGLSYPALETVLNFRNIRKRSKRAKLFTQIQLLERGFLKQERLNREGS